MGRHLSRATLLGYGGTAPATGRLNIRAKTGHKGSKKLGVQKGCRRIVKKCLFSQELATYLLASEKVSLTGRHTVFQRLRAVASSSAVWAFFRMGFEPRTPVSDEPAEDNLKLP